MTLRTLWMVMPSCPPQKDGGAIYTRVLIPYLLGRPSVRSILVVTETAKGAKIIERDGRCTFFRLIPDAKRFHPSAAMNRPWRIFSMGFAQLILSLYLFAALLRRHRNLIYVHDTYARGVVPTLIRFFGLNAICDVRDTVFFPRGMAAFSAVIACSMNLASRLARHVPVEKLSHIPVPFDIGALRRSAADPPPPLPVNDGYILFLGNVCREKGAHELIEAYSRLRAAVPSPPPLVLAGRVLIADADVIAEAHPGVFFVGAVRHDAVPAIISKARLVILPSRSDSIGRVILEAIALGIPVVCPPGIAEFDRYCPRCVLPEISVEAIYEALMRPPEEFIAREYPIDDHDSEVCLAKTASILGL